MPKKRRRLKTSGRRNIRSSRIRSRQAKRRRRTGSGKKKR